MDNSTDNKSTKLETDLSKQVSKQISDDSPTISFDDFTKLDIRIGTIVQVDKVPKTDKLFKLQVDFGHKVSNDQESSSDSDDSGQRDIRQIVSGIADRVTAEELLQAQCPFVVNLAPRTIRGVESNGMILAVGAGDVFALLHPHQEVESGAKVR